MSFQLTGAEEFSEKLTQLAGRLDEVAVDAVKAGGAILESDLKSAVTEAANRGYATGALAGSIKSGNARGSASGASVTIAPHGSAKKVRNSDKMWYLEHGTSRQAAHPFMTRTLNTAEPKVMKAMQEKLDAAIGGGS